jgi:hypothetical protein
VRALGKTMSNRARRFVMTETTRHSLRRRKASGDGADGPDGSILGKATRVRARLAAFDAKGPTVAVMGNCNRRNGTSLIVVTNIASAADAANEIAIEYATSWTFYIGHSRHLYAPETNGQRASANANTGLLSASMKVCSFVRGGRSGLRFGDGRHPCLDVETENIEVGFRTSFATGSRYGSAETGREQTMAQDLIFWVATASVCMGMGVLFVVFVALKQLTADDDPD